MGTAAPGESSGVAMTAMEAAAVGMRDGDHIVHVGESREQFGLDSAGSVLDGGRDALDGGRNAKNVAGTHAAIGIAITLESVAGERREWGGHGRAEGE